MTPDTTQNLELSSKAHILVVDDDTRIRSLVSRFLHENGFVAMGAASADDALTMLQRFDFDALIVDVMMPGKDGFEFLSELRVGNQVPVLMLTALGEAEDRITGLERGADDYLSKPFEPRELVLRLNSILKRSRKAEKKNTVYGIGQWVYDPEIDEIKSGVTIIRLTSVEAKLLRALVENLGEIMSREALADICEMDSGERTIDVQVTRLRRKIEESTKAPRYLLTVRGKGYMLRAEKI